MFKLSMTISKLQGQSATFRKMPLTMDKFMLFS